ncbi:TonB-dependent receptor [Novosphingobium sp. YAF33]|uniref:TonB-dependent receptor n=1 Tax=Novosphingobium sp. YAF33 TaxID=3233082 RepID=UPI003F99E755
MKFHCALLLSVSAVSFSSAAFAQDDGTAGDRAGSEPVSADILVTAQRRAESVQDVPIPVTVVGASQLQAQGIQEISDLGRTASSLKLAEQPGGSGGGGYIRGIGTFSRSRAAEPSVGIVVDGVVQGLTNVRNLSDIARVEVLRGPQGTLFGQSVSAGVINMTTVAPDPSRFSGRVSVDLTADDFAGSNFGKQVLRGAVNLPVTDNSALRVTGYGAWTQGVTENIYKGNDDYRKEWGFRGRYKLETGDFTLNLSAEYNDETRGNGYFLTVRDTGYVPLTYDASTGYYVPGAFVKQRAGQGSYDRVTACGLKPSINNYETCSDAVDLQRYKTQGYSGQFDVALNDLLTFTSITAWRKLTSTTNNDIDNIPEALALTSVQSGVSADYNQLTQEVRLSSDAKRPFSFTVGGFWYRNNVSSIAGPAAGASTKIYTRKGSLPIASCFPDSTSALCNVYITPGAFNNFQEWRTENFSGFGEARYNAGAFSVFAGGRLNYSDVSHRGLVVNLSAGGTERSASLKSTDTDFSWRSGVEYKSNRDLLLYGTVSRGYKNAQIAPIQNNDNPAIVLPEIPTSYEAGVKSTWLGGRLLANLSGFYTRVKDYQGSKCAIDVSQATTCTPFNIPKVISKGIEGDLFGRIGDNLRINANFIYNVVKYPDGFLAQDGSNLGGMQLANAPRFSASVYSDYSFALTDSADGFVGFDVSYKTKERLSDLSASSYFVYGGYATVGARIGAKVDDRWRVALYVQNLFNHTAPQQFSALVNQDGSRAPANVYGVFNTLAGLRQVGLQASMDF